MPTEPTVFVVDDDAEARASVCALVQSMGLTAQSFATAEEFLDTYNNQPGCVVTDVRMVGMSGIELQTCLNELGARIPVIVLTAFARTPLTVQALQGGALTMLDKPYHDDDLWDAIRHGLAVDAEQRAKCEQRQQVQSQIDSLTPSERKVMDFVVSGLPNKAIASRLDVSVRTVENRRREVFTKMKVRSVAELVRMIVHHGESD